MGGNQHRKIVGKKELKMDTRKWDKSKGMGEKKEWVWKTQGSDLRRGGCSGGSLPWGGEGAEPQKKWAEGGKIV